MRTSKDDAAAVNNLAVVAMTDISPKHCIGMTLNRYCYLVAYVALVFVSLAAPLHGQGRIRVALHVNESTNGLFQSALSSALRHLGDIDVVGRSKDAVFNVEAVVACNVNDCASASQYAASLRVSSVLTGSRAAFLTLAGDTAVMPLIRRWYNDIATRADSKVRSYERTWVTMVTLVSRPDVRSHIDELVAQLDSKCFENMRVQNRYAAAVRARDDALAGRLETRMADTTWMCRP